MPVLVVERGNDKGLTLKVDPGSVTLVGRDNPQAAVRLSDAMASRSHFQISAANGSFRIRDMKSRNGTLLNDEKLAPDHEAELKVGDKIQVGETIFSFLSDAKEETAAGGLIGKTIGGYQLLERVGRGGMGTVYRAEQISLKRTVALKVLSAKLLSDPVFVERFVQEARAAGGLLHPNNVQVIDVGSDRGIYYFSMEFMDHGSVGDIVAKEGPVPWERALEMLTDAAKGLIFAEKKGIIHRDIKPDNLMLTSEGSVKIGDLGLAKKSSDLAGEGGQIFGTPHFIAPEQAQGKPIDQRADLYALGATFYRVLSGRTPFTGENVKEILIKQVQEEPVPLPKLVPDLPDEVVAVLGKLMQKRPDDRYRSAQGLFEDLERIRVRYHLEAHGQAASARRNKIIAIVSVIVLLGVGGWAINMAMKPEKDPRIITITKPGETTPVEVDPAERARLLAQQAENAFTEVQTDYNKLLTRLHGAPGETWKEHEAAWEAVAKKFDGVATRKEFQGTPKAEAAAKEARSIREEIAAARVKETQETERARGAWKAVMEEVDRLAADGLPAQAVAVLLEKSAALLASSRAYLDAEAETAVKEKADDLVKAATDRIEPLVRLLGEKAPVFPGAEYLETRRTLDRERAGLVPAPAAKDEGSERLRTLAQSVRDSMRGARQTALDAAIAAVAEDTEGLYRTYLRIRRWAAEGAGPADDAPFFDYRWDECLRQWKDLLGRLRTRPFRDRVAAKIRHYEICRRLFETIASKVRARELFKGKMDPQFPDSVRNGTDVLLDTNLLDKATPDGVPVWRVSGSGRQRGFLEFSEMTPREFHEFFLRRGGDAIAFSATERLDLAVFLAEAGEGELAWGELAKAQVDAGAAGVEPAVKAWVESESTACLEVTGPGGILAARRDYEKSREEGSFRPAEIEGTRRALENRIHEYLTADRTLRTDYLLLRGYSLRGPEGAVPLRLFPAAVTDEVIRTLGTGTEVAAPPDDPDTVMPKDEGKADAPPKDEGSPVRDGDASPPAPGKEPGDTPETPK